MKMHVLLLAVTLFVTTILKDVEAKVKRRVNKNDERLDYIVQYKGEPTIGGYYKGMPTIGGQNKIDPNDPSVQTYAANLRQLHEKAAAAVGAKVSWSYVHAFNGFSARLTKPEAKFLGNINSIVSVKENSQFETETNTSPEFLGLTGSSGPWSMGYTGEDVVIGIIDTGIVPEHPSFEDRPTPINGNDGTLRPYSSEAPVGWTGTGCDFGNTIFRPEDKSFTCNNKLLTAKCFAVSFSIEVSPDLPCGGDGARLGPTEFLSARDSDGHGSHVASTAASNYGIDAIVNGEFVGEISGMAPRARIAVYKACFVRIVGIPASCPMADILAALDAAVADGVDVINASFGSILPKFNDADDIAFLRIADLGIFVSTAAGNHGPGPSTIGTPAGTPWVTAVGAAMDDGVMGVEIKVDGPRDVNSVFPALEAQTKMRLKDYGGVVSANVVLAEPLDACKDLENDADGKILLVIRGGCLFTTKFDVATEAGASLVVVFNDGTDTTRQQPISISAPDSEIPGIMVSYENGNFLMSSVPQTLEGELLSGTVSESVSRANTLADFSARGPYKGAMEIIKPDIVAPGVSIVAAGTPRESGPFVDLKGTSMASPHVAGIFALLKQVHGDWSPAMAKSAIMTTARSNLQKTLDGEPATPFDIGSGHVVPPSALDPGLAFDITMPEYQAFSCDTEFPVVDEEECIALKAMGYSTLIRELNYPSIAVPSLSGSITVNRTVTAVFRTSDEETFTAQLDDSPPGVIVSVSPSTITLRQNESVSYQVMLSTTNDAVSEEWVFGSMTWSSSNRTGNEYSVRSPIAVQPVRFTYPKSVSGIGSSIGSDVGGSLSFNVTFGFTGSYQAVVHGLDTGMSSIGTVREDEEGIYNFPDGRGISRFTFQLPEDTIFVRFALFDEFTGGSTDDLDLHVWECLTRAASLSEDSCTLAGESRLASSAEKVDIWNPKSGGNREDSVKYIVDVYGFLTQGNVTSFELFKWQLGNNDNRGNMMISAPSSAVAGRESELTVTWPAESSFATTMKCIGAISHKGIDSETLGFTLIEVADQ